MENNACKNGLFGNAGDRRIKQINEEYQTLTKLRDPSNISRRGRPTIFVVVLEVANSHLQRNVTIQSLL